MGGGTTRIQGAVTSYLGVAGRLLAESETRRRWPGVGRRLDGCAVATAQAGY